MTGTKTDASARAATWAAAILGVAAVVAFVARIPSVAQPLGIDQGLWAAVARSMWRGQELYRDVWDQKPPGIFLLYLATFRALGWSASSVAWLDILVSAGTAGLLFALVRRLSDRLTGAVAAALYAVLSFPPLLYGHGGFLERAVNESQIALCIAAAAWFGARAVARRPAALDLISLGACAGAATVFKPNAGVYLLALVAWVLFSGSRSEGDGPRASRLARRAGIALIAALVVPAGVVTWLWHHGLLREGWIASIHYNLTYVGGGPDAPAHWLAFSKAVWLRMKTEPLWLGGGIGSMAAAWTVARTRRLDPLPALAIAWGAAAAVAIYANGVWLFNNYFVQALPPLAVLTAWLLSSLWRREVGHRPAAWATLALFVALAGARNYPGRVTSALQSDLDALRGRTTRTAYLERFGAYASKRGYSARANDELRAHVQAATSAGDRIFVFGINAVEVYFTADRLPAQRLLRVNYFLPGTYPDAAFRLEAVARDLDAARPALIVFERLHTTSELGRLTDALPQNPALAPLLRSYVFDAQIEDFAVYRRSR